jgi:hypothetical protein
MMPLELPMSDATIWSTTLESSIKLQEVSFTLIYDVYNADITYGECQLTFVLCL